jgi:hypothetical protein
LAYLTLFYVSLLLYIALFILSLSGEKRPPLFYKLGFAPPVIVNALTVLAMTVQSGHLPSRYLFETSAALGLSLALLSWIVSFFLETRKIVRYVLLMIVLLFGISLLFPHQLSLRIYRYSLITAQLFFQLETIAFSLMLFSGAWFFSHLVDKGTNSEKRLSLERGRLFLLIGFIFFLAAQFFGSLWSLQGWGDYWMWGKMAFTGVVVWAYVMFLLHLRYVSLCGETFEAGMGSLIFVIALSYRMAWQP